MDDRVSAKLTKIDARSDGGANVWFQVRLGDYVLNTPVTVEGAAGADMAAVGKMARRRLAGLIAALAAETKRWLDD
ncbi:hypothetical protein Deba_2622 [Desulfarculus baarsii DSM 2075]|uniref:Uncharacterized protein n=1 Tax=Desulfarculus baarsii (strain ATCC 33931 / DSM 2075 / LMG 7858 / VKM B-1802 / 2st14) TaxID=644282 RepID=E1QK83_DESB2|nr:hypothetical protein [Desulfarculus baarsii]ADK85976.1 hypothetical protein Deba_2622 [Desulfarculus baarsii DSM 2075]